jgi:membrane protein YdbS with pleckstrin-like domain
MNFSLRPVFIGWITLLTQLPFQLFFTFWASIFFGGVGQSLGVFPKNGFSPSFLIGGLVFVTIPAITYIGKKLNYARTEYKFLDDRLEFEEGFFTINKKVIKYSNIKEITLRKGILQRMYGLGTIYLATLATGTSSNNWNFSYALGFGNVSASGIAVRDISNPDEAYEKIKKIADAHAG